MPCGVGVAKDANLFDKRVSARDLRFHPSFRDEKPQKAKFAVI